MWWNIVNTMPGRGTPRDAFSHGGGYRDGKPVPGTFPPQSEVGEAWDYEQEEVFYGGEGARRPMLPRQRDGSAPSWGPNWDEDIGAGEYPGSYFLYLQHICMNCSKPACLEACPYKRMYFNARRVVAQKCTSCFPRLEAGVAPACIRQCPGRTRHIDYLDNQKGHIDKLVYDWKVALPLRPDFGVEPNVFYVPPLAFKADGSFDDDVPRVPLYYLSELFGRGSRRPRQLSSGNEKRSPKEGVRS
jgi:ethylbenzene hydroxylase subunit beta/complex iron-sulfur molybdoenzyme family reductase subunit beta